MKTHIETLISRQYENLDENLQRRREMRKSCCDFKKVSFMDNISPDYKDAGQRSLYLLRYGPAYTIEYYMAYKKIITKNYFKGIVFSIASIGCGAYIDKASAFYALQEYGIKDMRYIGIDILDWGEDVISEVPHTFIKRDIQQLVPSNFQNSINIIMFPKSLPEISDYSLDRFLEKINMASYFQDKICVISSLRGRSCDDIERSNEFINKFCKSFGYRKQEIDEVNICGGRYKYIWDVYSFDFGYEERELPKNICQNCYNNRNCQEGSRELINKSPMLSTEYFNTVIYYLEKNHAMDKNRNPNTAWF